jgi:NAD(P)-dependent dehydrogenase (short-subunit alcohol dehydrogenase family)
VIDMDRLTDKVAIVTGAARGIGLAIAKRFVAEGAKVILADIDERTGTIEAKRLGAAARFAACDVGDSKQVNQLIEGACKAFSGDIDILVNNAGIRWWPQRRSGRRVRRSRVRGR